MARVPWNSTGGWEATFLQRRRYSPSFWRKRRITASRCQRKKCRWPMSEERVVRERAQAFYPRFERKAELQQQTHYCPGCGHGIVHKMIAAAIDLLGIQNRTILISPVGCSVFAYHYLDVGNIQAAHGRAPAVATAVKRSRPGSIVLSYQGDGDLSAIGSAEILHAANRGGNITVVFMNNAIYGMTGGPMGSAELPGQTKPPPP